MKIITKKKYDFFSINLRCLIFDRNHNQNDFINNNLKSKFGIIFYKLLYLLLIST